MGRCSYSLSLGHQATPIDLAGKMTK
jgi:hypothetical protein